MKHWKLFMVCAIAILAVAIPAASASATKSVLQLNEGGASPGGKAAAPGAPALIAIEIGTCVIASEGTLSGNDASKVKIAATKSTLIECNPEWSVSGMFTSAQLSTKGKLTLKGTFAVTTPAHCTYEFKKWTGAEMTLPGEAATQVKDVKGKLHKHATTTEKEKCSKESEEEHVFVSMASLEGEPFYAELVP